MFIESYSFGKIVINGNAYTSDVIIFSDSVHSPWWRKEGHYLQIVDIEQIIIAKPDILIIGTGHSGTMRVSEKVKRRLAQTGIEYLVERTTEAVEAYNNIGARDKAAAALHLTC